MKKLLLLGMMLCLGLLAGCDILTQSTLKTTPGIVSTATTPTTVATTGTTTTTGPATTASTGTTTVGTYEPFVLSGFDTIQDELDVIGIPATGDVKILVFAVDFSDYPAAASGVDLADIETAFNGLASETDYESVNSYYLESSRGALDLTADVYGFYRAQKPSSYYEDQYENATSCPDSDLIYELLTEYDDVIDYNDYDANHDGYLDGVYVVYTAPVSYDYGLDLWWAYQDIYIYEGDVFDETGPGTGAEPYYFVWAGTDFLLEGRDGLDARTWIHETGHMLGLEDYYDLDDYVNSNAGGLGGADMMDNNVGDHNPFSKLSLGWIDPIIIEGSCTVDLEAYVATGKTLLVIDEWNGTIFDEYFLIIFYTPEGLYEEDANKVFSNTGVLIYHIDARIDAGYNENWAYYSIYNCNNTDTAHKLVKIIEADEDGDIDKYWNAEDSDLFQTGDSLGGNVYPDYGWYFASPAPMPLVISIGVIDLDSASITVTFE
jgi:M6 family metalloprotease-like protein